MLDSLAELDLGDELTWEPSRVVPPDPWTGHLPFAFWLVKALRPVTLVELGTHSGNSYFAFCQAMAAFVPSGKAYAVDTWVGDDHSGHYDESIFADVSQYNFSHFGKFSTLLRSTFAEARQYFPDRSIDLLHIDGMHTYDAVRSDFETWESALSTRAVVVFHDTNVRERGFGVWRFWHEVSQRFPSFEFDHSNGLGVLGVGADQTTLLQALFRLRRDGAEAGALRRRIAARGEAFQRQVQVLDLRGELHAERNERVQLHARLVQAEAAAQRDAAQAAALATRVAELQRAHDDACGQRDAAVAERGVIQLERNAALTKLELAARARDAVASAHHAAMLACDAERRESEIARGERDAARNAYDAIKASEFWRFTYPVRRTVELIHSVFRRGLPDGGRDGQQPASPREHEPPPGPALLPDEPSPVLLPETETRSDYDIWVHDHDTLTDDDRAAIKDHIARLHAQPLISVVMPAYETPERLLREAIASVRRQLYPNWELCIADDASPTDTVTRILEDEAAGDPRVKWMRRSSNGHIASASNSAVALAQGEFVAFLDHDDLLAETALYEVAAELDQHAEADILFSDEDRITADGRRHTPYFKPDWDPDLMLGQNAVCHLAVYRRTLLERIGGLRTGYEGSQDYELILRASAATSPGRIRHIPAILYHWRETADPSSFSQTHFDRCVAAGQQAVRDHLHARGGAGRTAEVLPVPAAPFWNRVRWPLPDPPPRVSIIVPTRDRADLLGRCIDGLLHRTDYPDLEVVVADNGSTEADTLALFDRFRSEPRVRVVPLPGPFNYSALNNAAVRRATGQVIALINNDIDVIEPGWLKEMVSQVVRPDIGAVGAKLLYADGTVQHAGVLLGMGVFGNGPGIAGHVSLHEPRTEIGYFGSLVLSRSFSAVTAACLLVRREVFEAVGGLDEENLPVSFNDVDLCLRIGALGLRNVWTAFAELFHLESASRGPDDVPEHAERASRESRYMRMRWGDLLDNDPYYNANMSRLVAFPGIQIPPRRVRPWLAGRGS